MAVTQKDVDDLEAAINSGALRVRTNDREITYRSLEHMNATLAKMKRELGGTQRTPYKYSSYSRGYQCE